MDCASAYAASAAFAIAANDADAAADTAAAVATAEPLLLLLSPPLLLRMLLLMLRLCWLVPIWRRGLAETRDGTFVGEVGRLRNGLQARSESMRWN